MPLIDIHTESHNREEIWTHYETLFPDATLLVGVNEARIPRTLAAGSFRDRLLSLARRGLSVEALRLETHASDYALAKELVELHRLGIITPREPTVGLAPPLELPSTGQSHLDLAQQAMEDGRYSEALDHAKAGAREAPTDPRPLEMVAQLNELERTQNAQHPTRSALPLIVVEPDSEELKRLTAKERYILARIDGKRSVQAIMQVSPMHDMEALNIMQAFHRDGWIRFDQATVNLG